MKIFRLFGSVDRGALRPKRPLTFGWLDDMFAAGPLSGRWPGLEMTRARPGLLGSMPYLTTSVLVVEQSQSGAAAGVLDDYGEWLDASYGDTGYLVFNPTVRLDAVDEANSQWLHEHNDPVHGKPICIMREAFVADRVTVPVFRSFGPTRTMFLNGNTVDALVAAGYTGSEFIEIWDSETGFVP